MTRYLLNLQARDIEPDPEEFDLSTWESGDVSQELLEGLRMLGTQGEAATALWTVGEGIFFNSESGCFSAF